MLRDSVVGCCGIIIRVVLILEYSFMPVLSSQVLPAFN